MKKSKLIKIINEEIENVMANPYWKKNAWSGSPVGTNAKLQSVDASCPTYEGEKKQPCKCDCCASGDKEMTLEVGSHCFKSLIEVMKACKESGTIEECMMNGSKVKLNTPMIGDSKKYKAYVKDHNGIVKKVNF